MKPTNLSTVLFSWFILGSSFAIGSSLSSSASSDLNSTPENRTNPSEVQPPQDHGDATSTTTTTTSFLRGQRHQSEYSGKDDHKQDQGEPELPTSAATQLMGSSNIQPLRPLILEEEKKPAGDLAKTSRHRLNQKQEKGTNLHYDNQIMLPAKTHSFLEQTHKKNLSKHTSNHTQHKKPQKKQRRRATSSGSTSSSRQCPNGQPPLIVTCRTNTEQRCQDELEAAPGIDIIHYIHGTDFFTICVRADLDKNGKNISNEDMILNLLNHLVDVEHVEIDPPRTLSYLPASERRINMNQHRNLASQIVPYGVEMVQANLFWDRFGKRGEGITVCVIDTGLFRDHADFQIANQEGRLLGSNDDDLVTPWFSDKSSHGTHVSGTIVADDNVLGVVGVAPQATIFTARVFDDSGEFSATSLIAAMTECARNGANIISMSLGGPGSNYAERLKIEQLALTKGILMVAASGNDGDGINMVEYPSGYDKVMSVAAVDSQYQIASFSTHNSGVSIAAPGVNVLSTTVDLSSGISTESGYSEFTGTSMATPHVAGVAALLMSQFPNAKADDIREAMEASAKDNGSCGHDRLFGHGIVDALAAGDYLENNSGGASSSTENCVPVKISILTDKYGEETTYVVTDTSTGAMVYRGGPYPNGSEATFRDDIQLPPGCYEFKILDSEGDGTCCDPEYGKGSLAVEWDDQEQIFEDKFEGSVFTKTFGACAASVEEEIPDEGGTVETSPPDDEGNGQDDGQGAACGNGIVESDEECDDGNSDDNDSCTNECRIARCGDGIVQTEVEECDDGNQSNSDGCTNGCLLARCGDGFVHDGEEECDDGNNIDDDSCTNACQLPKCGDGILQSDNDEECDDGNDSNNDSCTNECQNAVCGDGFVQPGEACDDGNLDNGDGCSSDCQSEQEESEGEGDSEVGDGDTTTSCPEGQDNVELLLDTDRYSWSENELYFFDESSGDDDFVWRATTFGLLANYRYDLSECLPSSQCYKFYFFDSFGDGLSTGGLELKWNGLLVLDVQPNEVGERWQEGQATVYWELSLGNCNNKE